VPQRRAAPPPTTEPSPTVEPTYETVIVDVASDRNATSQRTPLPTATPRATPTPVPTAEVAGVQSTRSPTVDDVLMSSFEPMLAGGKIGLLGGAASTLGWLALKLLRGRKAGR